MQPSDDRAVNFAKPTGSAKSRRGVKRPSGVPADQWKWTAVAVEPVVPQLPAGVHRGRVAVEPVVPQPLNLNVLPLHLRHRHQQQRLQQQQVRCQQQGALLRAPSLPSGAIAAVGAAKSYLS